MIVFLLADSICIRTNNVLTLWRPNLEAAHPDYIYYIGDYIYYIAVSIEHTLKYTSYEEYTITNSNAPHCLE